MKAECRQCLQFNFCQHEECRGFIDKEKANTKENKRIYSDYHQVHVSKGKKIYFDWLKHRKK